MALFDLVPLFAAFLVFLICYMLLVAYKNTLGALLQVLANALHGVSVAGVHPLDFLAGAITAIDSEINAVLSAAVLNTQHAWEKILNITATLLHDTFRNVAEMGEAVERAFRHATTILLPSKILERTIPLTKSIAGLRREVADLVKSGVHATNTITHVVTHDIPTVITKVERVTIATTKTVVETSPRIATKVATEVAEAPTVALRAATHAIAGVLPRVDTLDREFPSLKKWVERHTKDLTIAGLASLLIGGVLAKVGMNWLRCANVGKAGRAICGMNTNALEALLGGLIAIFGTIGLVTFAKDVQDVVGDFSGEVAHFWRADVAGPGGDRALGSATLN
jgi:hypothetical protein